MAQQRKRANTRQPLKSD